MVIDHGTLLFIEVIATDASQHRDGDKADIRPWLYIFYFLFFIFIYSRLVFGYWKRLGLVGCQIPGMSKMKGVWFMFFLHTFVVFGQELARICLDLLLATVFVDLAWCTGRVWK